MGCDGGTIPRRDELVKTKKKPEQKDKTSERLYRWGHCAVSQVPFKRPIVVCEMGRMYNKDEIITRLLDRSIVIEIIAHIRGLKDIKELKLTPNPSYNAQNIPKGDEFVEDHTSEYICPVTSMEMNGKCRFVVIWGCGCVISERALKEIKSDICHKCGEPCSPEDIVPLNPRDDELISLCTAMMARRDKMRAAKMAKKASKRAINDDGEASGPGHDNKKKIARTCEVKAGSSAVMKVSGLASSVLRQKEFQKVRSSGFTVASDPKASEVYKSLFDTHKSAKHKTTAHWVTCNPQYF